MYYRRKVLLALIETFGGRLSPTDGQKLLFGYCQWAQQSHYDFFPHHYGAYSLMAAYDQDVLSFQGILTSGPGFKSLHAHEFQGDDALAAEIPSAEKYIG